MGKDAGQTLLVVDDDPTWLSACERALRDQYRVALAHDHAEAIELAKIEPVRIALVDLFMSPCTGVDVIRDLVAVRPGVFAVLVSAANTIDATVEAMRAGACHSVAKPGRRRELRQLLARLELERARARDRASSLALQQWTHVQSVLNRCDGNLSRAAKILGVDRGTAARIRDLIRPPR